MRSCSMHATPPSAASAATAARHAGTESPPNAPAAPRCSATMPDCVAACCRKRSATSLVMPHCARPGRRVRGATGAGGWAARRQAQGSSCTRDTHPLHMQRAPRAAAARAAHRMPHAACHVPHAACFMPRAPGAPHPLVLEHERHGRAVARHLGRRDLHLARARADRVVDRLAEVRLDAEALDLRGARGHGRSAGAPRERATSHARRVRGRPGLRRCDRHREAAPGARLTSWMYVKAFGGMCTMERTAPACGARGGGAAARVGGCTPGGAGAQAPPPPAQARRGAARRGAAAAAAARPRAPRRAPGRRPAAAAAAAAAAGACRERPRAAARRAARGRLGGAAPRPQPQPLRAAHLAAVLHGPSAPAGPGAPAYRPAAATRRAVGHIAGGGRGLVGINVFWKGRE
jgi:hypothetical protein